MGGQNRRAVAVAGEVGEGDPGELRLRGQRVTNAVFVNMGTGLT